nr:uncharacterized protein LOC123286244 [Equus asinus]
MVLRLGSWLEDAGRRGNQAGSDVRMGRTPLGREAGSVRDATCKRCLTVQRNSPSSAETSFRALTCAKNCAVLGLRRLRSYRRETSLKIITCLHVNMPVLVFLKQPCAQCPCQQTALSQESSVSLALAFQLRRYRLVCTKTPGRPPDKGCGWVFREGRERPASCCVRMLLCFHHREICSSVCSPRSPKPAVEEGRCLMEQALSASPEDARGCTDSPSR